MNGCISEYTSISGISLFYRFHGGFLAFRRVLVSPDVDFSFDEEFVAYLDHNQTRKIQLDALCDAHLRTDWRFGTVFRLAHSAAVVWHEPWNSFGFDDLNCIGVGDLFVVHGRHVRKEEVVPVKQHVPAEQSCRLSALLFSTNHVSVCIF